MSLGMRRLSKAKPNMAPPAVMCPLTAAMVGIPSVRMPQRNKSSASCSFPGKQWASCAADTCAPSQHHPLHWVKWHGSRTPSPTAAAAAAAAVLYFPKTSSHQNTRMFTERQQVWFETTNRKHVLEVCSIQKPRPRQGREKPPRRAKQMPACSISRLLFIVFFSVV